MAPFSLILHLANRRRFDDDGLQGSQFLRILRLGQRGTIGDLLLGSRQFEGKGETGWFAALLAIGLRQQFINPHRRWALMGLVVGCKLNAPVPGAVHQFDQALDFLARRLTVFDIAGPNLVSVEGDVMPALFPGQGVG